jgi:hypothetical protein
MGVMIAIFIMFFTRDVYGEIIFSGSFRSRFTYTEEGSSTSTIKLNLDADINIDNNSSVLIRLHYDYMNRDIKLTLDEGYIDLRFPYLYLTLGKRRLLFGQGFSFNPTDSVNPKKDLKELEETREGKEAVIIEIPKVIVPTFMLIPEEEDLWWFINLYFLLLGADANINYASKDRLFGLSLSKYLTDSFELHIEGAMNNGKDKYLIGTRYTFWGDGIAIFEYFKNDYALDNRREHLFFRIRKPDIIRDVTLEVQALYDLEDESFLLTPRLSYLVRDDVVLSIKTNLYNGKENSRFGRFDDEFILEGKVFF